MATALGRFILELRQRIALGKFRIGRRRQLRSLVRDAPRVRETCPVCGGTSASRFVFNRPGEVVNKNFCLSCEHLYSYEDQTNLLHGQIVFGFDRENAAKSTQTDLMLELAQKRGLKHGTFLDFGVGGNIRAFQDASARAPHHEFMACDTYPSAVAGYFNTYGPSAPRGIFDGISSYAVVEHLTNTIDAWALFNRLLKSVRDGGGLMLHSFPSQLHLSFDDWAMQIAGHSCLFSRASLLLTCRRTGFRLVSADPPRYVGPHYHPVMLFQKVRDV